MELVPPPDPANVADYLLAQGRPDDIAITDRDGDHTYASLRSAVARLSLRLERAVDAPGSRIGLVSGNSFFFVASYLAVMRSGHTVVPLATVLTPGDATAKARFVGCTTLLLDSPARGRFGDLARHMRTVLSEDALDGDAAVDLADVPAAAPAPEAALMFTSGTTGRPRAVRVTHANIMANTSSIIDYLSLARDDRMLVVLPFSYCYGLSLLHTHLRVGGSVAICDTLAFPETVVSALRDERCTGFAGVPSSYQLLLRASSLATAPLPSLRHLQQAGGRLPHAQVRDLAAAHPAARLFVMYGQTEATARLSYLPPEDIESRPGSIGRGVPGVTLRIADEDGRDVAVGDIGEIRARGANITAGYWDDPEASAAKYVDGELRTGDLARADADGYIYIVDRQADFIKSWGFRVSSHEVEDAIMELPAVVAAAVVGRPDRDAGEAIVAFCVPRDGADLAPEDITRHCATSLAKHLVPHDVRLVAELPLNANGKTDKSVLKARADDEAIRQPEASRRR